MRTKRAKFERLGASATTAPEPPRTEPSDLVAGLRKGLSVIESFNSIRSRLSVSEAARRAQISRAAARRYLLTLAELGYVGTDGKEYWLNPRVLRLAGAYLTSAELPRLLQPILNRVTALTGESAAAAVLDGDDVIHIARCVSARIVSYGLQPGTHLPAYCTSTGKMLVASLPPADADAWVARQTLKAFTRKTPVTHEALRAQIEAARHAGYAIASEEYEPGVAVIAVPVRNNAGEVLAAISVIVDPLRYAERDLVEKLLPPLRACELEARALLS